MKHVLLVAKETYRRQVKSWAFLMMIVAPFLFIGLSGGSGLLVGLSMEGSSETIAVVSDERDVRQAFEGVSDVTTEWTDVQKAEAALEEETIKGYLVVKVTDNQVQATYHATEEMGGREEQEFQQILTQLQTQLNYREAQLSAEQESVLERTVSYQVELKDQEGLDKLGKYIAFFGVTMMMYLMTIIYATTTAQEVAGEKGAKIMEVIFSSVPAPIYFYGRMLGICGVIATHMGIYLLGGIASYSLLGVGVGLIQGNPLVGAVLSNLNGLLIFFAIFGLLITVTFASLCGSLVVRQEDINKALQPVMYLIMAGFFGAFIFGQMTSEHLVLKIGSYIPFLSTFLMPVRMMNGWASNLEGWLSLLILVFATVGLVYLIGQSYAGLILQTDDIGLWKSLKKGFKNK